MAALTRDQYVEMTVFQGLSKKEIAERIGVSRTTVATYRIKFGFIPKTRPFIPSMFKLRSKGGNYMRKIISRGKRKDNGAWETGSLVVIRPGCSDESVYIADKMTGYYTPVDPNTVGEFSSFEDKNSKQIFEGDIVQHKTDYGCYKYVVVFENGQFCFKNGSRCIGMKHVVGLGEDLEIIGNVYDNPDLSPA